MRSLAQNPVRAAAAFGLFLVLAGCTAGSGGCSPWGNANPTTTVVDGSTTTTEPDGSTTTTEPDGSTTTTEPDGSTTTLPETSTTLPDGGTVALVDVLEVENCFSPTDDDTFVDEIMVIDCDAPHSMEVFAQFELDENDDYPGGSELTWAAQDECQERFEDYVGHSYWNSDFDLTVLTPSYSTWDTGDRTITCLLISGDGGLLTSPAKGAGR